jgi:NAD(P)-dependent dehydrogenase (short-subunit alcohol dehydrogenase family)
MNISGSVALVTGANRGLGERFTRLLLERGATVYAGARNPDTVTTAGAIPIRLDITDRATIAAAAEQLTDVNLLINNAGIAAAGRGTLLDADMDAIHAPMDTNFYGTLAVTRAFAPILATNGGGAIINVLSTLSWLTFPGLDAYSASKSAEWSLTNATRQVLAAQGTQVTALHVGYMDTDFTAGIDVPKADPADIARIALDGLEAGDPEILADDASRRIQQGLAGGVAALYPQR